MNGINNTCPSGFRIPTLEEWQEEVDTWTTQDAEGAFSSLLKIPMAGYRSFDGNLMEVGSVGGYWLSTTSPPLMNSSISRFYKITDSGTLSIGYVRTYGGCVRCIKD